MAVDVSSFTDTDIINGTLSHTVTITPTTEITSITYSVENSTLSNEVSVDTVGFTAEDTGSGTEVTLKPHILRHDPTSTGSADIVMTITDIYGRSVNVTNSVTLMNMSSTDATAAPSFRAVPMANTVDGLDLSKFHISVASTITPKGEVNGVANTNILSYFKGPVVDTSHNIIRAEFVNDGEFVVSTTQPSQCVPNMVSTGNVYIVTDRLADTFVYIPIAKITNYIPASWDEASIFDNLINTNTFTFKPNGTYVKLYTYNNGWDDRDYIIYTNNGNTRSINTAKDSSWGRTVTGSGSAASGLTGTVLDWSQPDSIPAGYDGAYLIPRFTDAKFKHVSASTGTTTSLNESTYGVTYSASSSSNSDKTPASTVYMYATGLANLITSGDSIQKSRGWILAIKPDLINSGVTTSNTIGRQIEGTTTLTFS